MIFKNMKKTLATILITGTMMGVSFAAEEKSFLDQIKSIFVKESPGNNNETLPQAATMKVAVNQPNEKVETLNTLDSVQSFNIKNDNDF
jgi:hypothetical protein